jgi:CheY-like chemotaxis protein
MKKILIVEDDESGRKIICATVKYIVGLETIDNVESAEEALEIFVPGKYDLIITDISLTKMNGLEFCLKIREIDKEVKIIALSGYSDLINEGNFHLAGFDSWFDKPFGYGDFLNEIKRLSCI